MLVVGGGSSGAIAAITAAREGMRTVLIDMNSGPRRHRAHSAAYTAAGSASAPASARRYGAVEDSVRRLASAAAGRYPEVEHRSEIVRAAHSRARCRSAGAVQRLRRRCARRNQRVCGVVIAHTPRPRSIRAQPVITQPATAMWLRLPARITSMAASVIMPYDGMRWRSPRGRASRATTSQAWSMSRTSRTTPARFLAGRRRGGSGGMHDHGIYVAPRESRHIRGD